MQLREIKKKCRIKFEANMQGMYSDDFIDLYNNRTKVNQKRSISMLPPEQLNVYDRLVQKNYEKQQQEIEQKQARAKPKPETFSKKQLIEKLLKQMEEHLGVKEKELFSEQNLNSKDPNLLKRRSQFFQDRDHMLMLMQMKDRLEQTEENKQQAQTRSISTYREPAIVLERRRSTLEQRLYEQKLMEYDKMQQSKQSRIQENVDKELMKKGLVKNKTQPMSLALPSNVTPIPFPILQTSTKSRLVIKRRKRDSYSIPTNNNTSIHTKNKSNLELPLGKCVSLGNLIQDCDNQLVSIQRMNNEFDKKKKIQFKKFDGIKNSLEAIGFYGFQQVKLK